MAGAMIDIAGQTVIRNTLFSNAVQKTSCYDEAEKLYSHYNKNNCYACAVIFNCAFLFSTNIY